jgi:hypothetical protein
VRGGGEGTFIFLELTRHISSNLTRRTSMSSFFRATVPSIMVTVQADKGAIPFLLKGADCMAPGLTSAGGMLPDGLAENTPVVREFAVMLFKIARQSCASSLSCFSKLLVNSMYLFFFSIKSRILRHFTFPFPPPPSPFLSHQAGHCHRGQAARHRCGDVENVIVGHSFCQQGCGH